jgi:Xaa-Pro aminopeptidase
MMEEEGLRDLGFQLLEYEWPTDREAELVRQTAGALDKVGADVGFADCPNLDSEIKKCRYSLTENEIERYLFLGSKLSAAIEKVALGVRPGDRECEIAGRIGAELWKDRIDPSGFQVAADERASLYRHPVPTTKMVKYYVMLCCNARYKGLITTITRIVHLGRPDPMLVERFRQNCEIECRMIEATKPGASFAAPFQTALEAYREFGYANEWLLHHQGGAMGYYARDIKVTPQTQEVVQENQAVCWNPSITGTKTEDGFIALQQGPLFITAPIIFPQLKLQVRDTAFVRPGLLVLD